MAFRDDEQQQQLLDVRLFRTQTPRDYNESWFCVIRYVVQHALGLAARKGPRVQGLNSNHCLHATQTSLMEISEVTI